MRILVKIGGAQLEQRDAREQLCAALAAAQQAGHQPIVVHGGGNQIRQLSRALAIQDRYLDGLRVTDADTAEVVLMVLAGSVNKTLCATLVDRGVRAIGLSGADGDLIRVRRLQKDGHDLGYVGEVDRVDPRPVELLLEGGYLPVLATVSPGPHGAGEPFYNLNADHAVGPLARALSCDAVLFLTDVPGVRGRGDAVLPRLSPADCDALVAEGIATGGMLPKLDAARRALAECPRALVKIAPAAGDDAVLQALSAEVGTQLTNAQDHQTGEQAHG